MNYKYKQRLAKYIFLPFLLIVYVLRIIIPKMKIIPLIKVRVPWPEPLFHCAISTSFSPYPPHLWCYISIHTKSSFLWISWTSRSLFFILSPQTPPQQTKSKERTSCRNSYLYFQELLKNKLFQTMSNRMNLQNRLQLWVT